MTKILTASIFFIIFFNTKLFAGSLIFGGYFSGNDYVLKNESAKQNYITGMVDGLLGSNMYLDEGSNATSKKIKNLDSCVNSKIENNYQMMKVVDKFVEDNPEMWSYPMSILFHEAIEKVCELEK